MSSNRPYKVLIGGGGTGGHVFPAIAIADALKRKDPGMDFLFVGALGRMEMQKVPEAGYRIIGLPVAGFQRRITGKNITFLFKLIASLRRSGKIIRQYAPHVAVGVGGYASGPILKAAARRNIPILLQEQNSFAGVTNRLLAKSALKICVAYENMDRFFPAGRIIFTGNPVRQDLMRLPRDHNRDLDEFQLEKGKKVLLIIGGSLGARTLNESFSEGLEKLDREDLQIIWQTGKYDYEQVNSRVKENENKRIRVSPFLERMDCAYGAADVIVSRSGALSISELCLIGKPVILVPSPNVAEDHQTRNAEALVSRKAAIMVPDRLAREQLVDNVLRLIDDEPQQMVLSTHIKQLGISDSSDRIAIEILKIIRDK